MKGRTLVSEDLIAGGVPFTRKTFREALKEDELQQALDQLYPAWADEQATMIYTQVLSPLDLLVLTATVDNRREIMKLQRAPEEDEQRHHAQTSTQRKAFKGRL